MSVHQGLSPLAALLFACAAGLLGCASGGGASSQAGPWITPYRSDVVQGNFIAAEQISQLKPGLSRLQVRNLMGTPLVSSLFHADRWDYVFSFKRGGGPVRLYRYSVFFKGDALVRFEGDAMPSESEFLAQLDVKRKLGAVPPLQATPEQLQAAQPAKPPQPSPSTANTVPAVAAPATPYPPLESE